MKRAARSDANGGAFKKSKQEIDSSGIGSKSKPCTKFFSTAGCPFGESCHFLHNVAGGYHTVSQMMNLGSTPASRPMSGPPKPNGSTTPSSVKKKLCNKYNTAEGCKFGDKCSFAHGEWELGKPMGQVVQDMGGPVASRYSGRVDRSSSAPVAGFGASATAKISVDASLAGPIIGKAGVNSKQICRQTGVKLSIRDHESDPNLRNIELEGTFDQIKEANAMVRELIVSISLMGKSMKVVGPGPGAYQASNYNTKLCDNFAKGSCTFGDRCHFAHGASELRKSGI